MEPGDDANLAGYVLLGYEMSIILNFFCKELYLLGSYNWRND